MRSPTTRSVRLRTIGGRLRVRSRRWVCSCTHATRDVRLRWYSVSACSTGWLVASTSASTSASSSAIATPWAMFGELAWAASPTSTTRPAVQAGGVTSSIGAKYASPPCSSRRGTGSAKSANVFAPLQPSSAGRISRVHVGIAVDRAVAERDREEGAVSAQHDCPLADLWEAFRDEPPARLPDVTRRRVGEGERADRRVDSIRTDHEVVLAGRAVGKARLALVTQVAQRKAEPDRSLGTAGAKRLVKRSSSDRDTAADAFPVAINVDVGEQTASVVEKPLPHDGARASGHLRQDPELVERPRAVAGQVHAGATRLPLGCPLDDLGRDAAEPQSAGKRQTGDAGTDDQDTERHGRRGSSRSSASKVLRNARRIPRASSNRSTTPATPPRGSYSTTSL